MKKKKSARKWSQVVTEHSNALDLEEGVFTWSDPHRIAKSLMRSALISTRRKGSAYQAAMSMLNFYINRAGKKLSFERKETLNEAKEELKTVFKEKMKEFSD